VTHTIVAPSQTVLDPTGCGHPHLTPAGAAWTLPNSLLGLAFAFLSWTKPSPMAGLLVARSNKGLARLFLTQRGFGAITFGRVVISAIPLTPELLMHEGHHAWQYGRLGPLFLPVYLWHQARGGYSANPLEREAAACAAAWQSAHSG